MTCLVFGVGPAGAAWIGRLARTEWFAGLEPQAEDLAVSGGTPAGCWIRPPARPRDRSCIDAGIEDFMAQAGLPDAVLATIAVPRPAGPSDLAMTLSLASALRRRRDPTGCRISVLVTVEDELSGGSDLVRRLQDCGAFIVQAGLGASGDHLHHFPLRAAIMPPTGRLVCVDLADHLASWRAGSTAALHVIPSSPEQAVRVVAQVSAAEVAAGRVHGLNLLAHLDPNGPGYRLTDLDRLAALCRSCFLGQEDDVVFTTASRLDGVTGTADLLLIHR